MEYFIQDMWPYKNPAKTKFNKAKIVSDKYHFIRQVHWAIENVRKAEQKRLSMDLRNIATIKLKY